MDLDLDDGSERASEEAPRFRVRETTEPGDLNEPDDSEPLVPPSLATEDLLAAFVKTFFLTMSSDTTTSSGLRFP